MHRLPKFLAYSSDRRKADSMRFGSGDGGSSSGSSRHGGKRKPRLDRRDARKDIKYNYEYSASSASTSSSSSCYSTTEESQRTRSLDLYVGQTSFRIEGMDGEIEIMCKNLGFEGIDDFGIAPEEYQVMKMRSSSAPVVLSQAIEELVEISGDGGGEVVDLPNREIEENDEFVRYLDRSGEVISRNPQEIPNYGNIDRGRGSVFGNRFVDSVRVSDVISSDHVSGKSSESRGGGIKGVRPPGLTPPPSMSLPVIDKNMSTWDIFRAFGPDNDTSNSRFERKSSLDDDEERVRGRNEDGDQEDGRTGIVPEENGVLSGSCSFTTNSNDDDSSSTTTDPVSSISPIVRFRRVTSWQKGQLLGRGSFGSVYEGIADDGFFFAVKEVSLLDQGDEGKQRILQLEQEIALLSQFQHENIVQYYGTATDESHLYIFLELVNQGSLFSLYQKYILKDSAVSGYTRQILLGLKYLHNRNVVHRDIKCANILVDTNGSVKLADFGLAKATKLNDVKSSKGTAFWMAPEVVRSQGYGLPADIWSLGCTVLEMLTRRFPYGNLECMQAVYRIGRGEKPPIPDSLSSDARDFMRRCLQVDPSLRPTAAQLLDHPFVKRPLPLSLGYTSPPSSARPI